MLANPDPCSSKPEVPTSLPAVSWGPPLALRGLFPVLAHGPRHVSQQQRAESFSCLESSCFLSCSISLTPARENSLPVRGHVIKWDPPRLFRSMTVITYSKSLMPGKVTLAESVSCAVDIFGEPFCFPELPSHHTLLMFLLAHWLFLLSHRPFPDLSTSVTSGPSLDPCPSLFSIPERSQPFPLV